MWSRRHLPSRKRYTDYIELFSSTCIHSLNKWKLSTSVVSLRGVLTRGMSLPSRMSIGEAADAKLVNGLMASHTTVAQSHRIAQHMHEQALLSARPLHRGCNTSRAVTHRPMLERTMNAIETALARFSEEMAKVDEMVHILLKGHLLIEEALSKIIDQFVFHREHVDEARLTFSTKMHLCRALCLRKNRLGEWDLIAALNSLRNVVAHQLSSPEREKRTARVKELYFREAAGMEGIEKINAQEDTTIIMLACGHCIGFLSNFEEDAGGLRRMIFDYDRAINGELPPFEL